MQTYFAIVHQGGDSAYGVWFPDLPGCFAAGDTEDAALASARKSLMLFAEDAEDDGEALPAARSLAALRRDADVRRSLEDSEAFFVAVPLIRNTGRTRRVNLELDVALVEMIDHVRREANLTRKAWFEQLARDCVFAYFSGEKTDRLARFKGKRGGV
jgi:predicted RNase H-like HicB family nuclease